MRVVAVLCLALMVATSAAAEEEPTVDFVVAGNIGASIMSDWLQSTGLGDDGTGVNLGLLVGLRAANWFQWDAFEVQWAKSNDPYGAGIDYSYTSLATGVRVGYFGRAIPVRPYIAGGGGGVGVALKGPGGKISGWGGSFNVGAGMNVPLGSGVEVGVRYRYRRSYANTFKFDGVVVISEPAYQQAHEIGVELLWGGR